MGCVVTLARMVPLSPDFGSVITGVFWFGVLLWVALIALGLWVFYLIVRTAVEQGIRRAARPPRIDAPYFERAAGWHRVDGGKRYWDGSQWTTGVIPTE